MPRHGPSVEATTVYELPAPWVPSMLSPASTDRSQNSIRDRLTAVSQTVTSSNRSRENASEVWAAFAWGSVWLSWQPDPADQTPVTFPFASSRCRTAASVRQSQPMRFWKILYSARFWGPEHDHQWSHGRSRSSLSSYNPPNRQACETKQPRERSCNNLTQGDSCWDGFPSEAGATNQLHDSTPIQEPGHPRMGTCSHHLSDDRLALRSRTEYAFPIARPFDLPPLRCHRRRWACGSNDASTRCYATALGA
jgi:hypothetical protein